MDYALTFERVCLIILGVEAALRWARWTLIARERPYLRIVLGTCVVNPLAWVLIGIRGLLYQNQDLPIAWLLGIDTLGIFSHVMLIAAGCLAYDHSNREWIIPALIARFALCAILALIISTVFRL